MNTTFRSATRQQERAENSIGTTVIAQVVLGHVQIPTTDPGYLNKSGFGNVPYWQPEDSARMPEFYNWSLNLQRQFSNSWVASVGYNATMGHHLTTNIVAINQLDPAVFNQYVSKLGIAAATNLFNASITSPEAIANGIQKSLSGVQWLCKAIPAALSPVQRHQHGG